MGNPMPVTEPGKSHYGGRGGGGTDRGWGEVLLNTVNWISLLKKKNKRQREKQHVSAKTTLVLDNS